MSARKDFTVCHIDHGEIAVDHMTAEDADSALERALADGWCDPVVFDGHIMAQASR